MSRGTRRESGVDGFFCFVFSGQKKNETTTGGRIQGWRVQKARKNNPQVNKFYDGKRNENKVARRRVPLRLHILLLKICRDHHRSVQQATATTAATVAVTTAATQPAVVHCGGGKRRRARARSRDNNNRAAGNTGPAAECRRNLPLTTVWRLAAVSGISVRAAAVGLRNTRALFALSSKFGPITQNQFSLTHFIVQNFRSSTICYQIFVEYGLKRISVK